MYFDFGSRRLFVCVGPVDMRCGAERLSQMVVTKMELSPLDNSAFLFTGKRRNMIKILVWDRNGFWLFTKHLYKGTYAWPKDEESVKKQVTAEAVAALLEGQDRWRRLEDTKGRELQ